MVAPSRSDWEDRFECRWQCCTRGKSSSSRTNCPCPRTSSSCPWTTKSSKIGEDCILLTVRYVWSCESIVVKNGLLTISDINYWYVKPFFTVTQCWGKSLSSDHKSLSLSLESLIQQHWQKVALWLKIYGLTVAFSVTNNVVFSVAVFRSEVAELCIHGAIMSLNFLWSKTRVTTHCRICSGCRGKTKAGTLFLTPGTQEQVFVSEDKVTVIFTKKITDISLNLIELYEKYHKSGFLNHGILCMY